MLDIFSLKVEEIASKIKDAQLTSVEVCEKYIEKINKFEICNLETTANTKNSIDVDKIQHEINCINNQLDIARKAAELFDELILVVAVNQEKSPLFNDKERVELIKESLYDVKNVKVDTFNGLVVEFVRSTDSVAIIRGLRHVSDFEFEFQMAMINFNLNPNIKSLFMMPDEKYIHLNSTVIKDVARLGGDISDYVPKCVQDALYKQYNV